MLNKMYRNSLLTAAALAILGVGSAANAQQLNGSLPLAGAVVTQDGSNLSTSTTVTATAAVTTGPGAGDYSPIPFLTVYSTVPLVLASPVTNNPTISNASWGSFTSSTFTILTHTATFYDVELFGVYTPGPALIAADGPRVATPGELRISINQSGTSLSEAITLSTPPANVPEPGSVAMMAGMGLTGAGFLVRRRRNK